MTTMFVLAQIFGVLGMISSILSMQFKKRGHILVALLLLNACSALNFLCLGQPSSCLIDLFGDAEMAINYQFERRGKTVPKIVVGTYIAITIAIGIMVADAAIDYMIVVAAIGFCFTVLAQDEQKIRWLWLIVLTLYIVYDLIVGAYVFALSGVLSIISTIIAIVRYRKNQKE